MPQVSLPQIETHQQQVQVPSFSLDVGWVLFPKSKQK
jgi:hypothetical protein